MIHILPSKPPSPSEEQLDLQSCSAIAIHRLQEYHRAVILSLIAAVSRNNVIGKQGDLPWNLPAELEYFRSVTRGKPVIMGRLTGESIYQRRGALLPGRHNIVVSTTPGTSFAGADVVASLDEAVQLATRDGLEEGFIIGGGRLYETALPMADRVYLTRVDTDIEGGDAFFPTFDESEWTVTESRRHDADVENDIPFTTMIYERKR